MKIFNNHLNMAILLSLLLPLATLLYLAPVNALPACGTITVSTYEFAGCTGGVLTIGASNINLGCRPGATITPSGGDGDGIDIIDVSHVNVFGCTVTGASNFGIALEGSYDSSLTGNTVTYAYSVGIFISSAYDVLTGNNVSDSGFSVTSGVPNSVAEGFWASYSVGITFAGNTASGNAATGFFLSSGDTNNTLVGNKATSNLGYGFIFGDSSFNVLSQNTATSNGGNSNAGGTGFVLTDYSLSNTVIDNTANTNLYDGFYLDSSSTGNVLVGNAAKGNPTFNADNLAGTANNFHTSLNTGIKSPYSGLQSL